MLERTLTPAPSQVAATAGARVVNITSQHLDRATSYYLGRGKLEEVKEDLEREECDVVIFDVRSPAEYSGEDVRAARGGHIPGAVNMNWTDAIDQTRNMRFKPEAELRAMLDGLGITPGKEVIAHCQTHHRSAHTYMVLKSLGFEKIRGYDGSWSEWGNDADTPTET